MSPRDPAELARIAPEAEDLVNTLDALYALLEACEDHIDGRGRPTKLHRPAAAGGVLPAARLEQAIMSNLAQAQEMCESPPTFTDEERARIRDFHVPGDRRPWNGALGNHPGGPRGYAEYCEQHQRKLRDLEYWG